MRTALFVSMFVSDALVFLIKMRDLRRNPGSPFLRVVCVALALATISALAGIPVVLTFLETTTGIPAIWVIGPLVATCAAIQASVLLWSTSLRDARRRILIRVAPYGTAITVMIVLVRLARGHITASDMVENQKDPEPLWGVTPYLRDAVLVYLAAMTFAFADTALHFIRSAKLVDRHWMRRGLLTLATGSMTFLLYLLTMAAFFVALRFGVSLPALHDGSVLAAAIGALILGVGTALPVLGPRWDRMLAYRRLGPLWLAVRQATPTVVLEPLWSARIDAWNPWHLDYRLYRRVIEIRDGALALRHYFDPDVAVRVRRLAAIAELPAALVDTTIEAAQLSSAIQARVAGHKPDGQSWRPPSVGSGGDLDAELASLVPLARAFTASPIVKTAARDDSHAVI
jgi:hypothetical protein